MAFGHGVGIGPGHGSSRRTRKSQRYAEVLPMLPVCSVTHVPG
jgi:hypothetical protein